jgi:hypothetical protein
MNPKLKPYAPIGLYVSLLAVLAAGGMYFIWRDFNLQVQIALGVAVLGIALYFLFDPEEARAALTGRQARYGSNALVLVLAFTGILVVVNYLIYKNPQEWDLTEDKVNTLTQETLAVLDSLEEPVMVTGYYTERASFSADQARELFDNYNLNSDGKITYEFVDPEANPVAAQAAGITQDRTVVLQSGALRKRSPLSASGN